MDKNKRLKIYKLLNIELFQKLVFKLEKLIHKKDHGHNINYHPKGTTIEEFEDYKKYLYYNGSIHFKNSILMIIAFIIGLCINNYIIAAISIILGIKDIYCVMLQRYNYIRINSTIEGKKQSVQKHYEKVKQEEKEIIKKYIKLDDVNIDTIKNLKRIVLENNSNININEEELKPLLNIIEEVNDKEKVYSIHKNKD